MGETYLFKCSKCDYEVESSGQRDRGFFAIVRPYTCNDCKIITDVLIGDQGQVIKKKELTSEHKDFYKCNECGGDNIKVWNKTKRPCPKCSSKMIKDSQGGIIMWD